jgi:hypothetical protein
MSRTAGWWISGGSVSRLVGFLLAIVCPVPVEAAETVRPVSERFSRPDVREVPDFQKHVIPLLGRLGCNSAKCHGSFQGKGGFRLSLFGFDFVSDHAALSAEATSEDGTRVKPSAAAASLVIRKPTLKTDHEGGKLLEAGSWEHRLLLRWIEAGAAGSKMSRVLARLDVSPREIVFAGKRSAVSLKVTANWKDGTSEDVTGLCRFRSNDDSVVTVDSLGHSNVAGIGDTHIVVFYDNGVTAVPVMRPRGGRSLDPSSETFANPIDGLVAAKLAKLGLEPSAVCSDAEFLRRANIDITGSLPTPDEIESFLASKRPDKRSRKINELLDRPAYAAWWTNKLCDFTGCSPTAQTDVLEVGQAMAIQWYRWVHRRVADNVGYDRLVEGIVLSEGRQGEQTVGEYSAEMSSYVRRQAPVDFSRRPTMPHYWTRKSIAKPKSKALAFAHSFLGVQLQCAECHKHPFDRWTQQDFTEFTGFFEGVGSRGGRVGFPQFAAARAGEVIRWPYLVARNGETRELQLLGSGKVRIEAGADPRRPIMKWMRDPKNPWFGRAFVNRVWASYFHIGLVDPPDAFTPANPPSHPALLKWLTAGFIDNKFNMKWLHRQITGSRAYQRSWKPNLTNRQDRRNFSRAIPRRLPAEVIYDAVKQATASTDKLQAVRNNLQRRATGFLSMRMAGTYAMNVFGKPSRSLNCDCERVNQPSLLQTVFLHNDPLVRMRLDESGWIDEVAEVATGPGAPPTVADRTNWIRLAWLRTVGRPPSEVEVSRAQRYLVTSESISEGLRDLMWALINTKEFVLNH